jgi:phospholipase C
MSNPLDPKHPHLGSVTVFQGPATLSTWIMPYPDPGEYYSDMVQQIFGSHHVPHGGSPAPMSGFAWNYSMQACSISGPDWPAVAPVPGNIMQYYSADTMPVTFALASAFAVCDCWFASAPVETLPNRTFAHCGTPTIIPNTKHSRVNNTDYLDPQYFDPLHGKVPVHDKTIFELLDDKFGSGQLNWVVYYHNVPVTALCDYVLQKIFAGAQNVNTFPTNFAAAVANDALPPYSFIEPRYLTASPSEPANSNHPGGSTLPSNGLNNLDAADLPPPVNVLDGEQLLSDVYSALAAHPQVFEKTLLIVTYDEHGGLFDHIGPPKATSPFSPHEVTNFDYDRYGVRVPTMLINPYIKQGTIYPHRAAHGPLPHPPYDHTSLLSTLIEQFDLQKGQLRRRVAHAPTLHGLISDTSRPLPACPSVPAKPSPPVQPPLPLCPPTLVLSRQRRYSLAAAIVPLYRTLELAKTRPRS